MEGGGASGTVSSCMIIHIQFLHSLFSMAYYDYVYVYVYICVPV